MYVKLFHKILNSSIWEESAPTRVVWITLLASMDSEGFCEFATPETLARRARVKPCYVKQAIAILEAPDSRSSTPDDDGRRIERVHGGWIVLNAKKYREITRSGELRSRKNASQPVTTCNNLSQHVTNFQLSTNEINKAVPEVEVEVDRDGIKPKRRASALPEGFEPKPNHHQLAQSLGVNLQESLAAFKDFHTSKGNTFKDWDAALRTWLRNERKFSRTQTPVNQSPPPNAMDKFRANVERLKGAS